MLRWLFAAAVYSQGSALHPAQPCAQPRAAPSNKEERGQGGALSGRRAHRTLIPWNALSLARLLSLSLACCHTLAAG